ncbi:unnamed protein product [Ambrosiozyma monospora]|uniref:Unnamed protein product n=1 Tax=Ambrosiozyma monospora TaxID=43982 RepID=A0ACB5TDC5_AMBMO|nr:unnamed protein product [Ambrosiozyma monospora]
MKELNLADLLRHIGSKLTVLFSELPAAIKSLERQREDFDFSKFDGDAAGLMSAGNVGGDAFADDDEDEEHNLATKDYLQFVNQETSVGDEFGDEGYMFSEFEDDDDDNAFANTTLDNINVFKSFKDTFEGLQSHDAEKYALVVGGLTQEEQEILNNVITAASA